MIKSNYRMFSLQRFIPYIQLMRLHRPIGILLLLWPTLWALWIAGNGHPVWKLVVIFVLGTVLMRSAGCVVNDLADRNFDGSVARTKDRPLVTKTVSIKEAFIIFILLTLLAASLLFFLNQLTFMLAIAGLVLSVIYPFMKRFTHLPQLILGSAFTWSVPMVFAAQQNRIPLLAGLIFFIGFLWTVAYDTIYAMVDREDDLLIGIKSTAILFGHADRLFIALLQLIIGSLLLVLGVILSLNIFYYICWLIAMSFFIYQQYLIKDRSSQQCFKAFLNNNYFGLMIFLGLVLGYWNPS